MTQEALARLLGRALMTVSRWERSETEPSAKDFGAMAEYLGVEYAWLALGRGHASADVAKNLTVLECVRNARRARKSAPLPKEAL